MTTYFDATATDNIAIEHTGLNESDMYQLLEQHTDYDAEQDDLGDYAQEILRSDQPNFAEFYFFSNLNGVGYVLRTYRDGIDANSSVYRVTNVTELSSPCEAVLKSTVNQVQINPCTVLAAYHVKAQPTPANESDTDVSIWMEHHYQAPCWSAPYDRFIMSNESSANLFDWQNSVRLFNTVEQAQYWINEQLSKPYQLKPNELKRPTFTVVS